MRLRATALAVAVISALAFSPTPASAADTTSLAVPALGVSPDVDPHAPDLFEDTGSVLDRSKLTGADYSWKTDRGAAGLSASSYQVWAACGIFTDNQKLVRAYKRKAMHTTSGAPGYVPAGTSNLRCGSEKWGYRHIVKNHLSQWEQNAAIERKNWRDLADFAINLSLSDPDKVTYRKANDTYCFSRQIVLINKRTGEVAAYKYPKVSIASVSKNVITAYLSDRQCSDSGA